MTSAYAPRGPETLYDKIWRDHVVAEDQGETILYVDLHLVHDATSAQAFSGLAASGRKPRRPDLALAVADHSVPTENQSHGIAAMRDVDARDQVEALTENSRRHGIELFALGDERNGIAHIVAPEQGRTHPGMVVVCGDSHTSTHGAFGALVFGIGTSDVEHVLATQTVRQRKLGNFRIRVEGEAPAFTSAKDMALFILGQLGSDGAQEHVVEYSGEAVRALSVEGRMTLCNMTVELGARTGLIAPDEKVIEYLAGRPGVPEGERWGRPTERWLTLRSDPDARFDRELVLRAEEIAPAVSWGTNPAQVIPVDGRIPDPRDQDPKARAGTKRALDYMGLAPGEPILGLKIDRVFIGSCTNSRIEDLRAAASVVRGRRVASGVRAMVVPGSGLVRRQAEAEGIDRTFTEAGFEWREPGCSMCVGMNDDQLGRGERCASTSNRNFENRQGPGGRTHLMSPVMAAAAAVAGAIADAREL